MVTTSDAKRELALRAALSEEEYRALVLCMVHFMRYVPSSEEYQDAQVVISKMQEAQRLDTGMLRYIAD